MRKYIAIAVLVLVAACDDGPTEPSEELDCRAFPEHEECQQDEPNEIVTGF